MDTIILSKRKFLLHSDQSLEKTGAIDKKLLVSLSGKRNPQLGYLPSFPDPRRKYFLEKQKYYQKLGFEDIEYFDVEDSHTASETEDFFSRDILHLGAGDPLIFLERIAQSEYLSPIIDFVNKGKLIVGVSAGAMLMGATLGIIPFLERKKYLSRQALFWVDFDVFPHWNENKASLADIERYVRQSKRKMLCLSDGDCIVVNGEKIKFYGEVIEVPMTR